MGLSEILGWCLIGVFLLIVGGIILCASFDREYMGIDEDVHP